MNDFHQAVRITNDVEVTGEAGEGVGSGVGGGVAYDKNKTNDLGGGFPRAVFSSQFIKYLLQLWDLE